MTDWKWRLFLFVRAADNTAANQQAFVDIFVQNGSGQSEDDERKMFDSLVRLSIDGQPPAVAWGVNTAAKPDMRAGFKALLDQLTNARYVVVANTDLPNYADHELVLTNFPVTPSGQIVSWQRALDYIEQEFGLVPIVEEGGV